MTLPATQPIEHELIELERQLSDALAKQDASVLDRLWSDDLVFTFPNGEVSNKAKRLTAQKPSAQPNQLTNTNEEVKVHLYGNTAVVTVRSRWSRIRNRTICRSLSSDTRVGKTTRALATRRGSCESGKDWMFSTQRAEQPIEVA